MASRKQAVLSLGAPKPAPGIYSQAIVANGMVYCSGQSPIDPKTNSLVEGGIGKRTQQCLENLSAVLEAAGTSLAKCVEVNVFLADMNDFAGMDEVYKTYFGNVKPARTCVSNAWNGLLALSLTMISCLAVKALPLNADVQIKCIALV